jgi:hypothetical protein
MFRTIDEGEKARHVSYYAYLVRGIHTEALERAMSLPQPGRWWEPPAYMIRAGDVQLFDWDANLALARVHLTVPEIDLGSYELMLCDDGCRMPLGNLIPSRVHVAEDPVAAQTARNLQKTNARLDLELARTRHALRETRHQLGAVDRDATASSEAVARLTDRLASRSEAPSPSWIAYVGWFFAGVLLTLVIVRRRHRMPPAEPALSRSFRVDDGISTVETERTSV